MTQPAPWSARLTRQVAGEIKRWRDVRGLSAQQLADACDAIGHPVPRSVIANLENGRRESITVAELLVLAQALAVPAVQLVVPIGSTEEVEILPGRSVSAEDAMLWFTGWRDLFKAESTARAGHGREDSATGLHEWYESGYDDAGYPVHRYAEHRQLVDEWAKAVDKARKRLPEAAAANSPAFRDEVAHLRESVERVLRNIRDDMRRRGLTVLPALPPGLEHLK